MVKSIGQGPLTMTVYNIEVEDTHTYFVGEAGIWVITAVLKKLLNYYYQHQNNKALDWQNS